MPILFAASPADPSAVSPAAPGPAPRAVRRPRRARTPGRFARATLVPWALAAFVACNKSGDMPEPDGGVPDVIDAAVPPVRRDLAAPPDGAAPPDARPDSVPLVRAELAPGTYHTCAITPSGAVRCWGWNNVGELGLGDTTQRGHLPGQTVAGFPAVPLGSGRTARAVAVGWHHSCAILDDETLKCWGSSVYGQCGQGQPTLYGDAPGEMGDALAVVDLGTGRRARQVVAGENHTCALLDSGDVKCWGEGTNGKLGLGGTQNRGAAPGEMGDALRRVDLGTGRSARALAAGRSHACALLDSGQVKCWGRNLGQLGVGDVADRGDEPGEMGDALPAVDLGTGRTATAIAAGDGHSCALLDNGRLKCWGMNYDGELGLGDATYRGDNPGELGDNLPVVDLGTGRTAKRVAAGGSHTCALLDNDLLKCWGSSISGEIGRGSQDSYGNKPGQMGEALMPIDLGTGRTVHAVASGYGHLCARLDSGAIKCWGGNRTGQLGIGDERARGDNPGEMGDRLPEVVLGP